jgi:hypothetical protein
MRTLSLFPVAFSLLAYAAGADDLVLIKDSQADCTIVIPNDASDTNRHAADELSAYLTKISGATLPIVPEAEAKDGLRIDVGPTSVALPLLSHEAKQNEESVTIRTHPRGVAICGGGDRGTLFAVYRFLERFLGCRWLTHSGHEHVPRMEIVALPPVAHESAPAFELRLFKCPDDPVQQSWGLKLGLNGLYTGEAASKNGRCYYYPEAIPSTHTWYKIIPAKQYMDAHPEWFPLLHGERAPGEVHNAQLCVTAKGLADEFAKNVIAVFDEDPASRITSISPNDGYGWCECDQCRALDEELCGARTTKQGLAKERPFRGDRVFWFSNEVARRVAEKHPDKMLLVLAYVNYAEPPDTVKPLPNVVPWLCHYAPADYAKPINDPTSEPNRQFNELLKPWAEAAPHLLFYGYVSKSMWWKLPRPVLRPFMADVKYLHSLGVRRYYAQSSLTDWALDGPLYYVLAKLLWDPTLDLNAVAQDWINHMFGDAAPHMTTFYQAVDDAVTHTGKPYSDNPRRDVPGLFHLPHLERARQALDAAAQTSGLSETETSRIASVTKTFLYGYHMVHAFEAVAEAKRTGDPAITKQAVKCGKEALSFLNVPKAADFVDSLDVYAELGGVMVRGFGKAETKGGRTCWNSDETGLGDNQAGWASSYIKVPDPTQPALLEMDVWGESRFNSIVVHDGRGQWNGVSPESRLSGKPQWDTMRFQIAPKLMVPEHALQEIGFGGGDSQVWVAAIRVTGAQ